MIEPTMSWPSLSFWLFLVSVSSVLCITTTNGRETENGKKIGEEASKT